MSGNIQDFIEFLGVEEENQMKSCVHLKEYFLLIGKFDILYKTILKETYIDKEEYKIPVFLFLNVHREFYLSMANFIRLHTGKSYCNLRSAIDSALTAYYLVINPEKQDIYLSERKAKIAGKKAEKEWSEIFSNIKRTIKKRLDYYPLAKGLIEAHSFCSMFAHADASELMPRCSDDTERGCLRAKYFDYEKSNEAYQKRLFDILCIFLEIYILFWDMLFKERATKKVLEDVNSRIKAFQKTMVELKTKFSSERGKA